MIQVIAGKEPGKNSYFYGIQTHLSWGATTNWATKPNVVSELFVSVEESDQYLR